MSQPTNVVFTASFMDPAPSNKALPSHTRKWEEVWGTLIALLTLTLPLAAISTYTPSSPPVNAKIVMTHPTK